jgi:Domain of unknown function (DUF4440)
MKIKNGTTAAFLLLATVMMACTEPAKKEELPAAKKYIPVSQELYDTIAKMDSLLFAALYKQDTIAARDFFTKDLEFYHDKGGLSNYQQNIAAFKTLFTKENGLTRELVQGSLEVYPIKDYGAIQEGRHRFCHPENGKPDCGTFKFIHIWKMEDGKWKISRIISYDH